MLTFKGSSEILPDERGTALLDCLLKNPPDAPIHATALEAKVDGTPIPDWLPSERRSGKTAIDAGENGVLTEASGSILASGDNTILKRKIQELNAAIEDETMPASERENAQTELNQLLSANGKGGKMLDQAGKAAERVRKALRRLLDHLNAAELRRNVPNPVLRDFGAHLETHLWLPSMGGKGRAGASGRPGCFTYEPPSGVVWKD
jgi:hypothetical protein